jgi:hypothetical protein
MNVGAFFQIVFTRTLFFRQDVTLVCLTALNFSATEHFESFGSSSLCLNLRHKKPQLANSLASTIAMVKEKYSRPVRVSLRR